MKNLDVRQLKLKTQAVHAGETPDEKTGASSPNIVMSSTYIASPEVGFSAENEEQSNEYVYSRWKNPTLEQLENKLAILENAEASVVFGSGMAAITSLFVTFLRPGDQLIMSDITYAGASEYANEILPNMGIEIDRVNLSDLPSLSAAIKPNCKMIYVESPCNPICRLTDIAAVTQVAKAHGAKVAVDSTFASPIATQPINLGADFVIHSLTKFMGGHGDALGGAVIGSQDDMDELRRVMLVHGGGVMSPFNAWLIMRGIATLPLRMRAHQEAATAVSQYLENHPKVEQVVYPGLSSHPQHDLAKQQMRNFSGMLTFRVKDGPRATRLFAEYLEIFHYAVSLGHHRSLLFYMPTDDLLSTTFKLTERQAASYRAYAGDGMFRTSIGIEDPDDLCADLEFALSKL
ncbi:MAG: PLP-dependent aspartate aminotransferase family protein [Chloroflexota bacterium]